MLFRSYAAATGDFNEDGKPDLAVADYYGNVVSILINRTTPYPAALVFASDNEPE